MKKTGNILSQIIKIIFLIVLIYILVIVYKEYKRQDFGDFAKAEYNMGIAKFTRDYEVKYSDAASYKIESQDFNDAMFYKEIEVIPNTAYKMSCMIKTENVMTKKNVTDAGAQICIMDTTERSINITGTNDWQKIEFMFESKNREKVSIGFRLGGNGDNAKGTAWFSDFKLEQGESLKEEDNTWNFAYFIFPNTDVTIKNEQGIEEKLKFTMSLDDVETIKQDTIRFKNSCEELSKGKMKVEYKVYQITEPITSVSYSEEHGYYVDPIDVKDKLMPYIEENEFDHIFIVVRLGDAELNKEIPVNDWIGLRKHGFI